MSSIGTGADGVSPASMEPPGITTLMCGSWVSIESVIKGVSKLIIILCTCIIYFKVVYPLMIFSKFVLGGPQKKKKNTTLRIVPN